MAFIYFPRGAGGASTDPGEENVLDGVDYEINGTPHTGTLPLTFPTAAQIAARVWEEATLDHIGDGTFGLLMQKLLTVGKFLGLK